MRPPSTTVLLFDLPGLLEDILVGALDAHPEIRVLRSPGDPAGPMAAALREGASVVVVSRAGPADLLGIDPWLVRTASIRVLAFDPDAARACLHTIELHAASMDDVSTTQVISVLATAGAGHA